MVSISDLTGGLRRASPEALKRLAERHGVDHAGRSKEALITDILREQGVETRIPPPPTAQVVVSEPVKAELPRFPIGKHSFLLGPGEKPLVSSSGLPVAAAPAASEAADKFSFLTGTKQKIVEPPASVPAPKPVVKLPAPRKPEVKAESKVELPVSRGRYAFLGEPGVTPVAVPAVAPLKGEPVKTPPVPAPKKEAVVAVKKEPVALGRYAFLMGPGEAPLVASSAAPAAPPKEEKKVAVPAPVPYNPSKELGRYSFLLGTGEVPEKTSMGTPSQ